jgi:hypothetical protein
MGRLLFYSVRKLPGICQKPIHFPAVKQGLILVYKSSEEHLLIELDVRKALVVSISQRSEELRLYKLV